MGVVSPSDLPGGALHESIKEMINAQEERVHLMIRNYLPVIEDVSRILLGKERIGGHYLRELLRREQKRAG